MSQIFQSLKDKGFNVLALHHSEAILKNDMPEAISDIESVLLNAELPAEELIRGGGGEGQLTQRIRRSLADLGWRKHNFEIRKIVDGVEKESISHEVDHVKHFSTGVFALEIEWNNKDPFFDRDLENFKRLHADGVISVGGIITRGDSLHQTMRAIVAQFCRNNSIATIEDLAAYDYRPTDRQRRMIETATERYGFEDGFAAVFVSDKFGEATTHWSKLESRVHRGVGNPCPLVLIGLPNTIVIL